MPSPLPPTPPTFAPVASFRQLAITFPPPVAGHLSPHGASSPAAPAWFLPGRKLLVTHAGTANAGPSGTSKIMLAGSHPRRLDSVAGANWSVDALARRRASGLGGCWLPAPRGMGGADMFFPHVDGQVRLPQPGEVWHMVEGVKDAAALHGLGLLACGMNTCLGLAAVAAWGLVGGNLRAADDAARDIVSTAVSAGSFKTLAAALQAGGLVETLQGEGPFTVFAPTDEAFAKLPAGTVETLLKPENKAKLVSVLTYHVVAGKVAAAQVVKMDAAATVNGQRVNIKVEDGNVQVDQATVVKADIQCSNGIIHVIDQVILPSSDKIPATATKAGTFKTLLAAAQAAGLVEVLSGDKSLTVFAPTDEAFAKLPAGTVENLLKPENKAKLAAILKFHVVAGRMFSNDVLSKKELKTVQGGMLTATMKSGKATINGAGLVATDIDAANGVIHVIDSVMLPPATPIKSSKASGVQQTFVSHVCPVTGKVTQVEVRSARRR